MSSILEPYAFYDVPDERRDQCPEYPEHPPDEHQVQRQVDEEAEGVGE